MARQSTTATKSSLNNMKHYLKRLLPILLAAALLSGCTPIPVRNQGQSSDASSPAESAEADTPANSYDEQEVTRYDIRKKDVTMKLNAEGGVFDSTIRTDGNFDGNGYIVLDKEQALVHIAEIDAPQHYRIGIAAFSYTGAAVSVSATEGNLGVFYIPPTDTAGFGMYYIDNVYLAEGATLLTFTVLSGTASLDYIMVEDSSAVSEVCYRTPVSVAGSNTGINTIGTMKYLTDMYGVRMLTAQNVTIGTNAEIDAVYAETGRYPAIRCGDLMFSSLYADEDDRETADKEVQLALEWGRNGGIVSMGWHWYAPDEDSPSCYSFQTDFSLTDAVTEEKIAQADIEQIEGWYNSGRVSDSCMRLVRDIDHIAETLKPFRTELQTVIFQPLPDGDSDLYWWSGDAESYKWLWQLMFTRLNRYHGLNNLIWVWNGSNPEYYPGDSYCDIIGQELYMSTAASYAGRFSAMAQLSPTSMKPVALTGCDMLPDPGFCKRDNAMWMWIAPASGEYSIHSDGSYSETYNSWQRINDIYNSRSCITRDELPDFSTYALEAAPETAEAIAE